VESAWFLYYMGSELGYIPIDIRFEDIVTAIILGPSQISDYTIYTIKAKSIGVNKLSDLEPGYSVDFVILDENLNVAKTVVNGRVAYD
jgi:N-acetylglucosamine-6-phosphate deacetylase